MAPRPRERPAMDAPCRSGPRGFGYPSPALHLGRPVVQNASEVGWSMAGLVGLGVGFVTALWRTDLRFGVVLIIPLSVAALEIVAITVRSGADAMAVWTPVLLALTVGATGVAM